METGNASKNNLVLNTVRKSHTRRGASVGPKTKHMYNFSENENAKYMQYLMLFMFLFSFEVPLLKYCIFAET